MIFDVHALFVVSSCTLCMRVYVQKIYDEPENTSTIHNAQWDVCACVCFRNFGIACMRIFRASSTQGHIEFAPAIWIFDTFQTICGHCATGGSREIQRGF